ncbi:hypothetical protein [Legionella drancourtii]|uniref:Protein kinase domain-containing protein n=1 Tax=Legionella drancourtii LLAP12 TaxID=658187 RepID=G9EQS9_9GAMM|nr:hypothetical protein [Legionella drancourtii]EHL30300.1 hypothetical protein LDG_7632 [Legionella drancourtii LLAP12]
MALLNNPFPVYNRSKLKTLIDRFNSCAEEDHANRLFYLQKINYALNQTTYDTFLFNWIQSKADKKGSWQSLLAYYGINPDASFFLKGVQFAKAVAKHVHDKPLPADELKSDKSQDELLPEKEPQEDEKRIYLLMQQRDELLEKTVSFKEEQTELALAQKQYLAISHEISQIAATHKRYKDIIERHEKILNLARRKINALKGYTDEKTSAYLTERLGKKHINNFNFTFKMKGLEEKLVVRVEDRGDLSEEQKLHAHEVAHDYFSDDAIVFMIEFKEEKDGDVVYKPLVLGQLARQGDLRSVARSLKGSPEDKIVGALKHYFKQINDFCIKLKKAGAYHPDMKLSNFLVDKEKILVCDRKTFLHDPNPLASKIRSTPHYAPPQYKDCLNEEQDGYLPIAGKVRFDMEQFMAYEIGMALKEFMLLSLFDEKKEEYWHPHANISSFTKKPSAQVTNIALIIREMTHEEEGKRLSIEKFQQLIPYIIQSPPNFYTKLQELHPISPEINTEIEQVQALIRNEQGLKGADFLAKANPMFMSISTRVPQEPRLAWFAEKLASKCYNECSKEYWTRFTDKMEQELANQNWAKAPWYRKLAYYLSFSFFNVAQVTDASELKIVDFKEPEFLSHFHQLDFLAPLEMESFGPVKLEHLTEFLNVHLEEITPEKFQQSPEDRTKDETKSVQTKTDSESPSGSVVYTGADKDSESPTGSVVYIKKDEDSESPSGTVVIKKDKVSESPSGTVVYKTTEQDDETPKTPATFAKNKKINKASKIAQSAQKFFAEAKKNGPQFPEEKPMKKGVRYGSWRIGEVGILHDLINKGEHGASFFATPPSMKQEQQKTSKTPSPLK